MQNNMIKRLKIFFIAVLVLLVVGMTLFGVLGFNKTIDNRNYYVMWIEVPNVGEDAQLLKDSSEKALKDNGLNYVSVQYLDDNDMIIYKFNQDMSSKQNAVKADIQSAINSKGHTVEVSVKQVVGGYLTQVGKVVLALGLSVVAIMIYSLIVEKLSGGLAVGCSTILSALVATALFGITRIPVGPKFGVLISISMVFGGALSAMLTAKYRAGLKTAEKVRPEEIAYNTHLSMIKSYIVIAVLLLVVTLLSLIGGVQVFLIGLGCLVSAISGIASSAYMTPFMWALIKGRKKK